jgi:hypothetical protein
VRSNGQRRLPVDRRPARADTRTSGSIPPSTDVRRDATVWGPPFAFGSFLQFYREIFPGGNAATLLPLIGSVGSGLIYLLSLVAVPMFARYPRWRTTGMWVGLVLCECNGTRSSRCGKLEAEAACPICRRRRSRQRKLCIDADAARLDPGRRLLARRHTPLLCLKHVSVGVVRGETGVGERHHPFRYRCAPVVTFGQASCVAWTAKSLRRLHIGLGGVLFPLLIDFLLSHYGHKTALRVLAGVFAGTVPLALPFVKSRLPPTQVVGTKKMDFGFLKSKVFWCLFSASVYDCDSPFFKADVDLPSK